MAFITRVVVVLKLVSCGSPTTISALKPSKSLTFSLHFLTAVSLFTYSVRFDCGGCLCSRYINIKSKKME
jgi:hypothetical protein